MLRALGIPWWRLAVLMIAAGLIATLSTAPSGGASLGLRLLGLLAFVGLALWEGTLVDAVVYAWAKVTGGSA